MAPKLYWMPLSPPSRAVVMCAKALGVELELVEVNLLNNEHLTDDYLKKNPQQTVPVLEEEDGFIVNDSHAIMAYLVSKYGKNNALYPINDYKLRSIIDHRMHFDSNLFARGLFISKPLLFYNTQPTQEKFDNIKAGLDVLETMLANNKTDYVAGNNLSIADFSIFTTKNPQHTVPVFEDDDGFIVNDSHAIMAYLVAKYGKNDDLCPITDYKLRAVIDHRLHFDSHLLFGRVIQISGPLCFKGIQPTKDKLDDVKDALKSLERILGDNKTDYVGGDSLSIADFSIFTTLGLINNFVPIAHYPNIMTYVKTIQKLPCQEVNKEGAAMLDAYISAALQK